MLLDVQPLQEPCSMTIINTKTDNWEVTFQADKLPELSASQQEQAKIFFALVGDALFAYHMLTNQAVRETLEFNYTFVISELTQSIQNSVMTAMQQQLWVTPLEGELSYDNLFGADLLEEIKNLAIQEQGLDELKGQFPENILPIDSETLLQQLFNNLEDITDEIEDKSSFEEEEDEDDDEEGEDEDDFTKH